MHVSACFWYRLFFVRTYKNCQTGFVTQIPTITKIFRDTGKLFFGGLDCLDFPEIQILNSGSKIDTNYSYIDYVLQNFIFMNALYMDLDNQ